MFIYIFIVIVLVLVGYYFLNEKYIFPKKIAKIERLLAEKDYEEALNLLENLPKSKKINPDIQYQIYDLYMKQSQYFMALFHLNEIVKRNLFTETHNEVFVRMKIAQVFEKMEKYKKALEEYKLVLELEPDNYEANYQVGKRLYFMKNYDAAFPFLKKARMLYDSDFNLNYYLAEIYQSRLEFDKVIDLTTYNIQKGDDDKNNFFLRGNAYLEQNKYPNCLNDMLEIEAHPILGAKVKIVMGICHAYLGEEQEALNIFSANLHQFNNDYSNVILHARYTLADLLRKKGELKEAIRQLTLIQSSGKEFKASKSRLNFYTSLDKSKLFSKLYNSDIEFFIKKVVSKKLSNNGYSVQKNMVINSDCCFFTAKKDISSRQTHNTVMGLDMGEAGTSEITARKFLEYINTEDLSSGIFFSFFDLHEEAKNVFANGPHEINLVDFEEINKILTGKRSL